MPADLSDSTNAPADDLVAVDTDALRTLANRVRGGVRLDVHDRMLYSTDASIYQVEPLGVVIPADLDDAAEAVRACFELGLPVLPRGGGTSLAGQCVNRAVVIDVSPSCRGVSEIDAESTSCRAEAGVSVGQLNAALSADENARGLFFAPDPATATHATIGGCIGNNAAGARSIMYGRTSESVLMVEVCLADGRRLTLGPGAGGRDPVALELAERVMDVCARHADLIRERFPKTVRRNAGYALDMVLAQMDEGESPETIDLSPLMCGAEGTLAFTLSARLRLHPAPAHTGLAVVSFTSVDDAIAAVAPLLALGPSAVELLDSMIMRLARENLEQRRHTELLPGGAEAEAVLYIEFQSTSAEGDETSAAAAVRDRLDTVRGMFTAGTVGVYTDPSAMDDAWALRRAGEPLLHGIPGDRKPVGFIEDAAVPPERLGEYVRRLREIVEREGTTASYYAHASVGMLHVRPLLDLSSETDRAAMERIALGSADLAKELGGVMSGEHGDGRARGPLLERFYGPELMAAFREVKAIFDPENRLNPGNIVEPGEIETIHERTRLGAERGHADAIGTFYDFSGQNGLAHAAGLCNGAGVCRKTVGGTMCPSYRATLDERHATRGRGNALRLAITGQLGDSGSPEWNDAETLDTLDLCLSCKACKSECPSNVDVAKMKAEYTAQGYRRAGRIPLRQRVFGGIHTLNRLAGIAPGPANLGMRLARPLANALLGLHTDRSLPAFEKPLHKRWGDDSAGPAGDDADAPTVILYADTFTAYNEPGLGLAARRVLEAFGYRVELFRGSDAGRALISVGMLGHAIKRADAETRRLVGRINDPHDPASAVLFLEPSCLSAVTDDWPSLNCETPGPDRRYLADHAFLVEQFLADRWDQHPTRPDFADGFHNEPLAQARGPAHENAHAHAVPPLARGAHSEGHQSIGEILLHAHCHQKALWGAGSSADFLERCFPGRVRTLDTTCCGLAGSFGYTRERFDLSMRIGELGVLPAAREAGPGDVVVAPGTSCRHQIKDGAGVQGVHPVELVADALPY